MQHLNKAGAGLPRRLRVALQSLRTNSSVIILKADKGNRVVVMDKSHYLSEAFEMLADTNVYELLRKNPIESEQASYNNEVRRIYESMPAGTAPYRFIAYLPTLAHLYLNPKIHKDPVSFRPIVSQAQSFTKPLSRFLSDVLTPFLGTFSPTHLKYSVHLNDSVHLKAL